MSKYMLYIQHEEQKAAYIEFPAADADMAKLAGQVLLEDYKKATRFFRSQYRHPYAADGNFSGPKPAIKTTSIFLWVPDKTAVNAWGVPCGGRWSPLK